MIKVMIVDDELIFRDYLKVVLPWEEYGFAIVSEARNGVEALEAATARLPDIALVDINMPFMDGLELTAHLKQLNPDIGIVLVTGHNEFEYARRALKLGVEDYVLKPFSKDELLLTLLKLQSNIHKALEERVTQRENDNLRKEAFLNRLLSGEPVREDDARRELSRLGFPPASGAFRVACIEIDRMDARWSDTNDRGLWKFAVANILGETIDAPGNQMIFNGPEGRIICVYEPEGADAADVDYAAGFERLRALILKYLRFEVTIGLGTLHGALGYAGIRQSYAEALEALRHKFVIGNGRVITYDSVEAGSWEDVADLLNAQINEELLLSLRKTDGDAAEQLIRAVFSGLRTKQVSIEYVYTACMGLVSDCLSALSEQGHPIEDCFGEHFYPYSEITELPSLEEAERWILKLYSDAIQYMKLHRQTKSGHIAEAALQIIDERYAEPELRVETIAQQVFINPSYLRSLFKKVHGMTVTDYLTQKRMQQARALIQEGTRKLSDIAESVGYSDPAYFSRAFKKFFGKSPKEFEPNKRG
ncbi:two-component system, response regulator YesN [Cohnella sp. OV330]|uniref:response regulator n=1 Tax=Cohnella sp. OV330 TaxID=1855288 RepID=UPI0008E0B8CE|nr:response regulator [Cohnella sp. OV330]SFB04116.1 two-component system, response regulator YesN [Cohnella sp. OV330]